MKNYQEWNKIKTNDKTQQERIVLFKAKGYEWEMCGFQNTNAVSLDWFILLPFLTEEGQKFNKFEPEDVEWWQEVKR